MSSFQQHEQQRQPPRQNQTVSIRSQQPTSYNGSNGSNSNNRSTTNSRSTRLSKSAISGGRIDMTNQFHPHHFEHPHHRHHHHGQYHHHQHGHDKDDDDDAYYNDGVMDSCGIIPPTSTTAATTTTRHQRTSQSSYSPMTNQRIQFSSTTSSSPSIRIPSYHHHHQQQQHHQRQQSQTTSPSSLRSYTNTDHTNDTNSNSIQSMYLEQQYRNITAPSSPSLQHHQKRRHNHHHHQSQTSVNNKSATTYSNSNNSNSKNIAGKDGKTNVAINNTKTNTNNINDGMDNCGFFNTWRFWRWCCCRYGWYPLLVAPLITTGCILSLYSSGGCDLVRVDIGFTPANDAWNATSNVNLGLFLYDADSITTDAAEDKIISKQVDRYRTTFFDGCQEYSDTFHQSFIQNDRTWTVSRIMAYVAGGSSILATITAWLFVVSPLPTFFFWPGVMLPSLLAAFLAEGSKFLFFDTTVCRNNVWFPTGSESSPQIAQNCSLGTTGIIAIAAGAVFFLSLMVVCLKTPHKRQLDPSYGYETDTSNFPSSDEESAEEDRRNNSYQRNLLYRGGESSNNESRYDGEEGYSRHGFDLTPQLDIDDDIEGSSYVNSTSHGRTESEFGFSTNEYQHDNGSTGEEDGCEMIISNSGRLQTKMLSPINDQSLINESSSPSDEDEDDKLHELLQEEDDDRYDLEKPPSKFSSIGDRRVDDDDTSTVSQSRLSTAEKVKQNVRASDSNQLIDRFVNEMNPMAMFGGKGPGNCIRNQTTTKGIDDEETNASTARKEMSVATSTTEEQKPPIADIASPTSSGVISPLSSVHNQHYLESRNQQPTMFQTFCVGPGSNNDPLS